MEAQGSSAANGRPWLEKHLAKFPFVLGLGLVENFRHGLGEAKATADAGGEAVEDRLAGAARLGRTPEGCRVGNDGNNTEERCRSDL